MEYPVLIPITFVLESCGCGSLEARDPGGNEFSPVDPETYDNAKKKGQTYTVEFVHDSTAAADTCCLYMNQGGMKVCVKRC
jgi:hypothetical protein